MFFWIVLILMSMFSAVFLKISFAVSFEHSLKLIDVIDILVEEEKTVWSSLLLLLWHTFLLYLSLNFLSHLFFPCDWHYHCHRHQFFSHCSFCCWQWGSASWKHNNNSEIRDCISHILLMKLTAFLYCWVHVTLFENVCIFD